MVARPRLLACLQHVVVALPAVLVLACASPSSPTASSTALTPSARPAQAARPAASGGAIVPVASGSTSASRVETPAPPQEVSAKRALSILFLDDAPEGAKSCLGESNRDKAIECMLAVRYQTDPRALQDALAIYHTAGWVAGLEQERMMDGGWRGMLKLVPELPVAQHRRHLAYLKHTASQMVLFFTALEQHSQSKPRYRWRGLEIKFFRSVGRTTPSAYARSWSIAYNVSGSLHSSPEAVRETMFHEIFHLNDDNWSNESLLALHQAIIKRCKIGNRLSTPCLTPYAPHKTMVRGGTYYAFEPGNGVWEYAAELAVRYNQEQRARWLNGPARAPFKCGPDENARAWSALVKDMFAGIDDVPACR